MKSPEEFFKRNGHKEHLDILGFKRSTGLDHSEAMVALNNNRFFRNTENRRLYYKKASESTNEISDEQLLAEQLVEFYQGQSKTNSDLVDYCQKGGSVCFTSYLFGTLIHDEFWTTLLNYCFINEYRLVVIPQKYKNPSSLAESIVQQKFEDENNDPRVIPFLVFDRVFLPQLTVLADVRVQPTAVTPYTGLEPLSEGKNLLLGHATQHLHSLPRMLPELPRFILTTGSVSALPPVESLAAKRYENDHALGAVVYTPGADILMRHIHAGQDGSFYDLNQKYNQEGQTGTNALYSVWGDSHFGQEDLTAHAWATALTEYTGASKILINDSFDGSTVNPHVDYTYQKYALFPTISAEVEHHNKWIAKLTERFQVYRIDSNHDDMLTRASHTMKLSDTVCKDDAKILYKAFIDGHASVLDGELVKGGEVLEGFQLLHGHERFNGARGGKKSYTKLSHRSIHNHTHQPSLMRGHYGNGCLCKLNPDYTKGSFTSWAFSITNVYPGHKAQLLVNWTNGDLN